MKNVKNWVMAAPDEFLYEYAVVRYVPRVDREEFVNIGLIMLCKRRRWLKGKILLNPGRLQAFDPAVNLEFLGSQATLFTRGDVPSPELPVEERYRWLAAVKSAVLQVSPSHPGFIPAAQGAGDPSAVLEAEFDRLFGQLVS